MSYNPNVNLEPFHLNFRDLPSADSVRRRSQKGDQVLQGLEHVMTFMNQNREEAWVKVSATILKVQGAKDMFSTIRRMHDDEGIGLNDNTKFWLELMLAFHEQYVNGAVVVDEMDLLCNEIVFGPEEEEPEEDVEEED